MLKVLFFDLRDSEKPFFDNKNCKDFDITFYEDALTEKTKLSNEVYNETEALCVYRTSILTERILSKFKNLRIIATRSHGFNHIDLGYCIKNRIAVANIEQYGKEAVAEYALCLILALERKIKQAVIDIRENSVNHKKYEGNILRGLKIGIIGCGNVGLRLAEISRFFGMEPMVSSYKEHFSYNTICDLVPFDKLLETSDIIALHMPFVTETYQIIGREEFQKMKRGVLLINTSCVELINIEALYENLLTGKVSGAGLDILDSDFGMNKSLRNIGNETMSSPQNYKITAKLLELPNVIITPHISYNTVDTINFVLETTFNNIRDLQKGMNTNRIC